MSKNTKSDLSELKKFQKQVEQLSKTTSIDINELFTNNFMVRNTNFSNQDDFFNACNIYTQEDLEEIPDSEMDKLVKKFTKFNSWQDMLDESAIEYISKKLDI